ncbi:carrier protein (macronuclear) [Tetrahymena thermophila SB210]|uniref:Carrier protein n=1 Tax=Tetrahymena thermophila (strain SB210) TaxID=312017 RepID=I7M2H5_TETTS|nr:carrier protein [Tetrahymena thermophila SB210]EAS00401.1 carrier protein [Tetrahymena thermophila SB210]|eukprot:XP_001020646.1 carrier protein [Tetrahymena thermophila SB210]
MIPDAFNNSFYPNKQKYTFWRYTISSFVAHAITRTVLAPIERLKILFQTQKIMRVLEQDRYTSYLSAIRRIYSEQGFLSFWRGNGTNIYRVIPTNMIKFATFIHFKEEIFPKGEYRYSGLDLISRHFLCGMSSVFFIQMFCYPYDVIRTRQICDQTKAFETRMYGGTWDTMRKLLRTEKYKSLYKAFWINYFCGAPYLALAYTFYEHIRSLYHPSVPEDQQPPQNMLFKLMGAGGLAAAGASIITYPLDTIRRRMMVNGGIGFEREYKNVFDCVKKIAQNEGMKGYYGGFFANLVKVVPALGLQFSVFDNTRMLIFE